MIRTMSGVFGFMTGLLVLMYFVVSAAPVGASAALHPGRFAVTADASDEASAHVGRTIRIAVSKVTGEPGPVQQEQQDLDVQVDPEWTRFATGELELWLPLGFIGGNLDEDLAIILDTLRGLGPDYEPTADMLEQNPSLFRLFTFNPDHIDSGILTNVNVMRESVFSSMQTDAYIDAMAANLPSGFEIRERDQISHSRFDDASRAITHVSIAGATPMRQATYFFKTDDNVIWTVTYTAAESIFDEQLPLFERSAESFSVISD